MSWLETAPMNEKIKFISAYLEAKQECTFKELCSRFNISCKTGYKYINRFELEGIDGLKERSRAPHCNAKKNTKVDGGTNIGSESQVSSLGL